MNEEEMNEVMMQGINRFLFWSWNFESVPYMMNVFGKRCRVMVPEVIVKAKWTCGVDHMVEKWLAATEHSEPAALFPMFYMELSADNRRALLQWVINNYKREMKL